MNYRLSIILVVMSLCLAPVVMADSSTRDFDTIDNAPEEKERGLVDADADGLSDDVEPTSSPLHEGAVESKADPLYEGVKDTDDDGDSVPTETGSDVTSYGDVDGDGYGDVAATANVCPDDQVLCRDGTCAPVLSRCLDDLEAQEARALAARCSDDKCIAEVLDACGDDVCVSAVKNISVSGGKAPAGIGSGDCDDSDCPVRPDAAARGEIIPGEDREAAACPDDVCVVTAAERCADDVCRASVAEHCRDEQCVLEIAERCDTGRCKAEIGADGVCGPDGCPAGITDRPTAQREASVVAQRVHDRTTPLLYQGLSVRNMSEDDKEDISEYLANKSTLRGQDFGLAVAYAASGNEQVRNVRYNNETAEVEVDHVEQVRLFGFIPLRANARSSVRADGEVRTQLPWWSFIATKSAESTAWMSPEQVSQSVSKRSTGRNPQTGKEIQIAAK